MIVSPSGTFKDHLEQQGLKAESYEIDDSRFQELAVKFAQDHANETTEQLQERIEYACIWERYGIPPDEKGQDFVNSRRVIEMGEMLREAKKSDIPQIMDVLKGIHMWARANADTQVNCNQVVREQNTALLEALRGDIRARLFRNEEWQTFSAKTIADVTKLFKRSVIAVCLLLIALIIATMLSGRAHAQVDVVQIQEAGVTKATFAAPFKMNFSSCTVSKSGSTVTISGCAAGGTTHNFLSATHSDTVAASPVLGGVVYANATPAWAQLAGNTTTTKKFLTQTGDGAASAAPAWGTISISADVTGLGANVATFLGTPSSANLRAALTDESGTGVAVFAGGDVGAATATTPSAADNTTKVATTAFVQTELGSYGTKAGIQNQSYVYAADAQANDTYVITLSPAPGAYAAGQHFTFKANTANTGAATLNVNALGAKAIKKFVGAAKSDPADGDIRANGIYDVIYDGTDMLIQSTLGNSGGGTTVAATGFYLTISGTNYIPQNMFTATLPSAATYAWTNQASATETATNSALVLTDPATDGNNWKIRTASIGANTTLISAQICQLQYASATFPGCGIGLRESATGKIVLISFTQIGGQIGLVVQNWDSATAFGGTIVSEFLITPPTVIYFKTTYNGTNVTFHWSADGVTFKQFLTETKTTHFTTAPDQFFYGINGGNDGFANSVTLLSWGVS